MSQRLVMNFLNASGKKVSMSVRGVKEDITDEAVKGCMDTIIAKNIFLSSGGDLKTKESAQLVETTIDELEVK